MLHNRKYPINFLVDGITFAKYEHSIMIEYDYWGGSNPPPENLKTTKQLAEIGLKGVKTVAFIETRKYTISLYDINDINSVKPKKQATTKQLDALRKARIESRKKAWIKKYGWIDKYRVEAVLRSRELLATPDNWVILDIETTGLFNCELVEIAVIDGPEVLNVKILRIVSKLCIGIGDTKFDQLMTLFSIDNGFYLGKTQRL